MEELLRHLIQKAESRGGAEWLRRCLEEDAIPSASASADMEHAQSVPMEVSMDDSLPAPPAGVKRSRRGNKGKRLRSDISPSPPVREQLMQERSRSSDRARVDSPQEASAGLSCEVPASGQPVSVDHYSGEKNDLHVIELGKVVGSLANVLAKMGEPVNIGNVWSGGGSGGLNSADNAVLSQGNPAIPISFNHLSENKLPIKHNTNINVNPSMPVSVANSTFSLPVKTLVSESCFKEALPCELSPLGYHLSNAVKEKIWRGDFIDILSLLPSSKEFLLKSDKRIDDRSEEDRRRAIPRTFQNWLQAFCIFASVVGERFPDKCSGLFQHLDIVAEAYRHFGAIAWFNYDESFRQKLSVHPSLRWGVKDVGLWLNLMLPQRPQYTQRPPVTNVQSTFRKGVCFANNDSQCRFLSNCRYKHECSFCAGMHPASRCFKKSASTSQSRDINAKDMDASEVVKNAVLARSLSRPQDGGPSL